MENKIVNSNIKSKSEIERMFSSISLKVQIISSSFVSFTEKTKLEEKSNDQKVKPRLNYLDVVFCIDTTASMQDYIE